MAAAGRDASVRLEDGRVLEYWDGGDPEGRPVILHPGTPVTRILGRWAHEPATAAGVRLIAVNRPGYGGSTLPDGAPSLRAVGRDTVELTTRLGIEGFGVVGYSGGGPFALATAIASGGVRAVGVVGGAGPWAVLRPASEYPDDRACLALLEPGDASRTWSCFAEQVRNEWASLSPDEITDAILGTEGALVKVPDYRALWVENAASISQSSDGYVFDNIAWGGPWDIDPGEVRAPTTLWFGTGDAVCPPDLYGRWYADHVPDAELIVIPSPGHGDTCDGHWPEVFSGLLRAWA